MVNAPERSDIYHRSGAEDLELSVFAQQLMQVQGQRRPLLVMDPRLFGFADHLIGDLRLDFRTTKAVFGIERGDWCRGIQLPLQKRSA